jgi:hypothetical protein
MGLNPFRRTKHERSRQPLYNDSGLRRPQSTYYASEAPKREDSVRSRQASEQRHNFFSRLRLVPTIIALGVICLSIVYNTTLSTSPGINFAGDTPVYRSADAYKDDIAKILNSSLFNHSKLTINTKSTITAILKAYPELDAATISLPIIGRRPTVTLHAQNPVLILTTQTSALVLGANGKAVAETKQLMSSLTDKLLTVQDKSGVQVHAGDQALSTETVSFIADLAAQLAAKQLTIESLILPSGGNELDVRVKDQVYYLKTDVSGDARLQIGAFLAARDGGAKPAEYMDVRVEEKVFYK